MEPMSSRNHSYSASGSVAARTAAETALDADPAGYLVSPLFAIGHAAGFADVTPFADRSGIYFASTRAGRGNLDLYFSGRIVQDNEQETGASAVSSSSSGI